MDRLDGDVQRIAKQRVWSEAEGKRMVAAWHRSVHVAIPATVLSANDYRIDRPFEVDVFERVDRTPTPERRTIPFNVRLR